MTTKTNGTCCYFGRCPECPCGTEHKCRNVGSSHFFYCPVHKKFWCVGSNLFSSWRHESEETWRENAALLSQFTEIPCAESHCEQCWPDNAFRKLEEIVKCVFDEQLREEGAETVDENDAAVLALVQAAANRAYCGLDSVLGAVEKIALEQADDEADIRGNEQRANQWREFAGSLRLLKYRSSSFLIPVSSDP